MPQHDWQELRALRSCNVCDAMQRLDRRSGNWQPWVSPICPGDDDDRDPPGHRPAPGGAGSRILDLEYV
jgi:hypothetical protein